MTTRRFTVLTALFALALLVSVPAMAGGPLANCQSGVPFLWPNGGADVPFNPDQGDLGPLTGAQAVLLTQQAFDEWGNVATSSISYLNAGQLPVDVDITNFGPFLNAPAPDGLSAIVFDDTGEIFDLVFGPGSGVLGFAGPEWGNTLDCTITEGLSFLNGPSFTDLTAALDVMVHEFGHYSNLAHTVVNGQILIGDTSGPTPDNTYGAPPITEVETMYPFYFGPAVGFATVEKDDIAILSTLYPEPGFFSSTGTITGTIFAPNGTTKLTGVNVIARNAADPFNDAISAISSDFTDNFAQADPFTGVYTLTGLTPGASYEIFVDEILAGGFSTPPLTPLPDAEEFYNGALESNDGNTDLPLDRVGVSAAAGATTSGIDIIFNAPPPGVLDLGDDDNVELSLSFPFDFCGQTFSSVFVNSNGSLTFGAGSNDFSESVAEFLSGPPRIAGLWDDLNPSSGGTVSFTSSPSQFTVTFDSVPEFPSTGANTFTMKIHNGSSKIEIDWGAISATDGLAGFSCGGAVTSGNETESDLSTLNTVNVSQGGIQKTAIFELFTGDNDLDNDGVKFVNFKGGFADTFEPNDTLLTAAPVTLPFNSGDNGAFTSIDPVGGDVDFFRFDADQGDTLIAEVLAGQLDSVLGVFDINNGTLIAFDDDGGAGVLSRIVVPIPVAGPYAVAVSAFPDTDFTGDGASGGRYTLSVELVDGILLDLGDDDSEEVPLGFSFPFQGSSFTSVFVNSNGNLTFGSGDTDFSESVAELLNDQPRIAALWDDLSPNNGGQVTVSLDAGSATVSFDNVPEFISTGSNTFDVTLNADGSVVIEYGAVSALDGIVGVSPGGGAANPGETDLSAAGSLSVNGVTYEQFLSTDGLIP